MLKQQEGPCYVFSFAQWDVPEVLYYNLSVLGE